MIAASVSRRNGRGDIDDRAGWEGECGYHRLRIRAMEFAVYFPDNHCGAIDADLGFHIILLEVLERPAESVPGRPPGALPG